MLRIGILGCGNIARIIAAHCNAVARIAACFDLDEGRMRSFAQQTGAQSCRNIDALLQHDYDLLLETASVQAARDHVPQALATGKEVVVLSVGAFTDKDFLKTVRAAAREHGLRVHVPSGAIFGLDNLKVAQIAGMETLLLKTTKHPDTLGLENTGDARLVFRGSASEAVTRFPKNINVSAALALATGVEPQVELWADPAAGCNRHEIEASGAFGTVWIRTDNLPSPENPATSYLAALSVLALLKRLGDPVQIGT